MSLNSCCTMFMACSLGFVVAGCSFETTPEDVEAAREAVREEQQETDAARREMAENVAKEERETEQARNQSDSTDVEEEARETREAEREGREAVAVEERETLKAEQKANETEAKLAREQERKKYVQSVEQKLNEAELRLTSLEKSADAASDAEADRINARIDRIESAREAVEEKLDELKSADVMKWKQHQAGVDRALDTLKNEMRSEG